MNHPTKFAMLVAAAAFALSAQPALAKDTPKGNWSKDTAQGYCNDKAGSTFWSSPDGMNYGCGYKGGGGLLCDKEAGCMESDGKSEKRDTPLGLLGLLGLAGLIGFMGVKHRRERVEPVR